MKKKGVLTKILAIAGTVLVWFPILTPAWLSVTAIISEHMFRFDYLMPAELFPVALIGGGLLLWAALRVHSRQKLIAWGLSAQSACWVPARGWPLSQGWPRARPRRLAGGGRLPWRRSLPIPWR
jgi:hypothetical protein